MYLNWFFFKFQNIYLIELFFKASALVNHLLSVSNATDIEDDLDKTYLIETNIAGYLVVYDL